MEAKKKRNCAPSLSWGETWFRTTDKRRPTDRQVLNNSQKNTDMWKNPNVGNKTINTRGAQAKRDRQVKEQNATTRNWKATSHLSWWLKRRVL